MASAQFPEASGLSQSGSSADQSLISPQSGSSADQSLISLQPPQTRDDDIRTLNCIADLTSHVRIPNQSEHFYEDSAGTGNFKGSVANLVNSAVGAGMLSLPYAYQCAGAVLGSFLLLLFGLIVAYSLHLIGRAQKFANAKTYQDSVKKLVGPKAEIVVIVFQLVFLVGACIGFLDIIPDQLLPFFSHLIGSDNVIARREFLICAVAVLIILPLMFVRSIQKLWPLATFSIIAVVYATGLIVVRSICRLLHDDPLQYVMGEPEPDLASQVSLCRASFDIFKAIPIFCFAYNVHTTYPIVFGELNAPKRLSRMDKATGLSIFACFLVYVSCGLSGLLFGVASHHKKIPGDALVMFPPELDVTIGRFCVAASVVASYTSLHFSARICLQDLFKACGWISPEGFTSRQYTIEIFVFLICTVGVSMVLQQLDFVLGLVGSVACIPFMLVFPGLLQVKMDTSTGTWSFRLKSRRKGYSLIVLGFILGLVGLFVTCFLP